MIYKVKKIISYFNSLHNETKNRFFLLISFRHGHAFALKFTKNEHEKKNAQVLSIKHHRVMPELPHLYYTPSSFSDSSLDMEEAGRVISRKLTQ